MAVGVVAVERSEDVLATVAGGDRILTHDERARAAALTARDARDDFIAAHLLVRVCVAVVRRCDPFDVIVLQRCDTCGGSHGRPRLPDGAGWQISLAHARGVVAAAATPSPVGVDVERMPGTTAVEGSVGDLVLTAAERTAVDAAEVPAAAFLRLWVGKETLVKIGRCSLDTMGEVELPGLVARDVVRLDELSVRVWHDERLDALVGVTTGAPWRRWSLDAIERGLVTQDPG